MATVRLTTMQLFLVLTADSLAFPFVRCRIEQNTTICIVIMDILAQFALCALPLCTVFHTLACEYSNIFEMTTLSQTLSNFHSIWHAFFCVKFNSFVCVMMILCIYNTLPRFPIEKTHSNFWKTLVDFGIGAICVEHFNMKYAFRQNSASHISFMILFFYVQIICSFAFSCFPHCRIFPLILSFQILFLYRRNAIGFTEGMASG